ncbi:hypothetical protein Aduo_006098 [Ancylostoma duodenale]
MLFFVPLILIPVITNGGTIRPSIPPTVGGNAIYEPVENEVVVDVVGESKCPDTTRFIFNMLLPAFKKFWSRLRINYHPYGPFKHTACSNSSRAGFECTCQHGPDECRKNALQACVINALPEAGDYLDIVACIQGPHSFNNALQNCILSGPFGGRLDKNKIVQCANSEEGMTLMAQHGAKVRLFADNVNWVPWISIEGLRIPAAEKHFQEVLCYQYFQPQPIECQTLR